MFNLADKVALVTGAQRGMGAADARALAGQGATVILTDIIEDTCEEVAEEIRNNGGNAQAKKMDVADEEEVKRVFAEVVEEHGRLDILVNNAGIFTPKPAADITDEDWQRVIEINLNGQFRCAREAAHYMRESGGGRIINISSIASGQVGIGFPNAAHYTASKGGVIGMTETLANEWGSEGITVNAITPGLIKTPMIDEAGFSDEALEQIVARVPVKRPGRPEEIAAAVTFLASDEASYVNGANLTVDGGWLTT